MLNILEWLGNAYSFYRAAQDAGIWIVESHSIQMQEYLESYLVTKNKA